MNTSAYEARLRRVLDYIHANPAGDLSLDNLADIAAMSRFHWHRVFHGMTGETCAQAVRRIRLHRAACWLVQTQQSVDEIALSAGFASREAFARAFKLAYGTPPASFRNRGDLTPHMHRRTKEDFTMFDISITAFPARRMVALAHTGPYLEVGRAFEQLQAIATARGLWPHVRGMAGLYYDDPSAVAPEKLRSHAGLLVTDGIKTPEGLEEIRIAEGDFAVLQFKGPYAGLKRAYDYAFGDWLPKSGREPGDAPAMEIYHNGPHDTAPDDLLTDICVPLA